nr:ThuA domain-containing protein [Pedobacter panaciterrae]
MKLKTLFFKLLTAKWSTLITLFVLAISLCSCAVHSPANAQKKSKAIRILMVGGGSSHDFDKWYKEVDVNTLEKDGLATVTYTSDVNTILSKLSDIDVLMLTNNQPMKDPDLRKAIFAFVNSGKGLVLAHAALWYNWKDWPEYNAQLVSGGSNGHDKYGSFEVTVVDAKHPVTKGVDQKFTLKDERYYYKPDPTGPGIKVLANSSVAGSTDIYPSVFTVNHPKARIVGLALGHDAESHDLPVYQMLLRNAVKWVSAK